MTDRELLELIAAQVGTHTNKVETLANDVSETKKRCMKDSKKQMEDLRIWKIE